MIDDISKRISPVYQGLRATAQLMPQSGDEHAFVGIYASHSAETVLTEIGNFFIE